MSTTSIRPTCIKLAELANPIVKRAALLGCLALVLAVPGLATPPPSGPGGGRPRVVFDENSTPLQRALDQTVKNKRDQMRSSSPACESAVQDLEDLEAREAAGEEIDPKVKERAEKKVASTCKVPRVKTEKFGKDKCPDCGDKVNPAGKVVGKKIVTETTLDFDTPDERGRSNWADVKFPARLMNPLAGQGVPSGANAVRVRSAVLFADSSSNDDKDCVDRVTGAHKGGLDPTTSAPYPDGDPASCFAASGELKATLEVIQGGCRHIETGATYSGDPSDGIADDCYDENGALQTTLEELVDEDPSEAGDEDGDGMHGEDPPGDVDGDGNPNDDNDCLADAGDIRRGASCVDASGKLLAGFMWLVDEDGDDPIDQDEDGFFDEDAPVASDVAAACNAAGGDLVGEDGCDLSRAVIAAVNRQAMEEHGMKIFKADENGHCDPEAAEGEVDCGSEARKVKLTETFVVRCEPGAEFVDGECMTPVEMAPASVESFNLPDTVSRARLAVGPSSPEGASATGEAMMGFTFAPPVIEWGYKIEEEACVDLGVDEVCGEVFFARVGYEFDIAAGLRLPVQVTIEDLPAEGAPPPYARAETQSTLTSKIEPLDFTAQQYKDFCQQHHLDQEPFIASCERFSFPEFLSSTVNQLLPGSVTVDGSEFVGRAVIFAGLKVRVAMIPVISYGVDVDLDVPTLCTFNQIFNLNDPQLNLSLLNLGVDAGSALNILKAIKDSGLNCASFTTPWGDAPDSVTGVPRLRTFPLAKTFTIPADCAQALVEGPRVNIKGKIRPICTGILVGMNGASMGVDLGLELAFGSTLITADWDVSGDAATNVSDREADFEDLLSSDPSEPQLGPITFDNYANGTDEGVVSLDNFTYWLNAFQLRLSAKLGFGGILSPIPDIADFTLLTIEFSGGKFGIPIPQHAGTEPIQVPVFVENHALSLHASPETLLIKPGEFGQFTVGVDNLGSVSGTMDQFTRALSNIRNQNSPFRFEINQNTDLDCVDSASGAHFRGDPYDGVADDCFTAGGEVRAGRTETINEDDIGPAGALAAVRDEDGDGLADEDPPDVWATLPDAATFGAQSIQGVPAHSTSSQTVTLSVSPFRHPLTAPGLYPVQIAADSQEARTQDLAAQDPLGQARLDASDVVFIQVDSFFDPQVAVQPDAPSAKPGVGVNYTFEGSNGGNTADTVLLSTEFSDFNQAGCTLTTLGSGSGCPYRAVPTQIPSAQWTTVGSLEESYGPLEPLGVAQRNFSILVPSDWAGMENTTYKFIFTGTSSSDPEAPPAKNSVVIRQMVIATKESMTRYIGLEIYELIGEIESARGQGVRTGGTLPIAQRAVKSTNDRALQNILGGNLAGASRNHAANIRIMQGFLRALDGAKVPAPYADDWRARANAMISDMVRARASTVASAAAGPAPTATAAASRKR